MKSKWLRGKGKEHSRRWSAMAVTQLSWQDYQVFDSYTSSQSCSSICTHINTDSKPTSIPASWLIAVKSCFLADLTANSQHVFPVIILVNCKWELMEHVLLIDVVNSPLWKQHQTFDFIVFTVALRKLCVSGNVTYWSDSSPSTTKKSVSCGLPVKTKHCRLCALSAASKRGLAGDFGQGCMVLGLFVCSTYWRESHCRFSDGSRI